MDTYVPMDASKISYEDRAKYLAALMFITEKCNDDIKAVKCAVGSKQRTYEGYEETNGSSPTVMNDAVFIT